MACWNWWNAWNKKTPKNLKNYGVFWKVVSSDIKELGFAVSRLNTRKHLESIWRDNLTWAPLLIFKRAIHTGTIRELYVWAFTTQLRTQDHRGLEGRSQSQCLSEYVLIDTRVAKWPHDKFWGAAGELVCSEASWRQSGWKRPLHRPKADNRRLSCSFQLRLLIPWNKIRVQIPRASKIFGNMLKTETLCAWRSEDFLSKVKKKKKSSQKEALAEHGK